MASATPAEKSPSQGTIEAQLREVCPVLDLAKTGKQT